MIENEFNAQELIDNMSKMPMGFDFNLTEVINLDVRVVSQAQEGISRRGYFVMTHFGGPIATGGCFRIMFGSSDSKPKIGFETDVEFNYSFKEYTEASLIAFIKAGMRAVGLLDLEGNPTEKYLKALSP